MVNAVEANSSLADLTRVVENTRKMKIKFKIFQTRIVLIQIKTPAHHNMN